MSPHKKLKKPSASGALLLLLLLAIVSTASARLTISFDSSPHVGADIVVPGLYSRADLVTPIRGEKQFAELVFGQSIANSTGSKNNTELLAQLGANQTISLVQFYMATCPDCQGFSPYFKRFALDVSPHWTNLVSFYTVNCNDYENIHLCQQENPKLIVPTVRWYAFPVLQRELASKSALKGQFGLEFADSLLNVAHRQFIEKQRRDLISLRRATLKYTALVLNELTGGSGASRRRLTCPRVDALKSEGTVGANEVLASSLRQPAHSLAELGACKRNLVDNKEQFVSDLNDKIELCLRQLKAANATLQEGKPMTIYNFIVFETPHSYIGRTLVADWSNHTCQTIEETEKDTLAAFMVHHTSDMSLLKHVRVDNKSRRTREDTDGNQILDEANPETSLFVFKLNVADKPFGLDNLALRLLAANRTLTGSSRLALSRPHRPHHHHHHHHRLHNMDFHGNERHYFRTKRHSHAETLQKRPERLSQRASLQRYYTRSQPFKYASSMTNADGRTSRKVLRRARRSSLTQQANVEHANWVPELVYPREEWLRHEFNREIVELFFAGGHAHGNHSRDSFAGSLLDGQNPDEIPKVIGNTSDVVPAKDDDLVFLLLTDYYRILHEIVHVDLLEKGDLDGFQSLANLCFVRDLTRHFPFQGNALLADADSAEPKSTSRHFLQLVHRESVEQFKKHFGAPTHIGANCLAPAARTRKADKSGHDESHADKGDAADEIDRLTNSKMPIGELEAIQADVDRKYDIRLPHAKHFKWQYCAGSMEYLRGHTCSLWILFHTMTVHELLADRPQVLHELGDANSTAPEYKFQIDYAKAPRRACDPANPDEAYLAAKPVELFRRETHFALANIINFVRFYLPCTNCAAHFSCMVEHSPGLQFRNESQPAGRDNDASHLLWLWEGHNRVNERTRGTHSEDPKRPKHIFAVYEACPSCYLERPAANATFASMRFNRNELVKFIVRRYRRSAILNNKVNIEDLHKKPV